MVVTHPSTKGIGFVGSTEAGRSLYELAGKHGKRASINAGAKNYAVIMPDADLDSAVEVLISSSFGMAGQRCLASSNLLAIGDICEPFRNKFVEAASRIKLGYGLDERTEMGTVISKQSKETILGYVEKGVAEGAKLLLDGRNPKVEGYPRGYFGANSVRRGIARDGNCERRDIRSCRVYNEQSPQP